MIYQAQSTFSSFCFELNRLLDEIPRWMDFRVRSLSFPHTAHCLLGKNFRELDLKIGWFTTDVDGPTYALFEGGAHLESVYNLNQLIFTLQTLEEEAR